MAVYCSNKQLLPFIVVNDQFWTSSCVELWNFAALKNIESMINVFGKVKSRYILLFSLKNHYMTHFYDREHRDLAPRPFMSYTTQIFRLATNNTPHITDSTYSPNLQLTSSNNTTPTTKQIALVKQKWNKDRMKSPI